MKFKANTPNTAPMTLREETQMKYNRSRGNLLLVLLFTVINLFTVTFGDSYFLFSATIPMLFPLGCAGIAADPEFMAEMGLAAEDATTLMIVGLVIGVVLVIPYLLCWIFSKKAGAGWMIFALVLITLDTGLMFLMNGFAIAYLADTIIHICIIVSLGKGISACHRLKHLPPEPVDGSVAEIIQE